MSTHVDRRVQKTHRALRDALVQLTLERGWDKISVRDVCERANVGRSTFYIHFADKEELLLGGLADLRDALRTRTNANKDGPLAFALPLFEHLREWEPLFRALLGKRMANLVHRALVDFVTSLVREDLAAVPDGRARDAAAAYLAGAFWELARWWIESAKALPAQDVSAMYHAMTVPVLRSVERASSRGLGQKAQSVRK